MHIASLELKQWYKMRDALRIDKDGILEVRFVENEQEKLRIVCTVPKLVERLSSGKLID